MSACEGLSKAPHGVVLVSMSTALGACTRRSACVMVSRTWEIDSVGPVTQSDAIWWKRALCTRREGMAGMQSIEKKHHRLGCACVRLGFKS